MIVIVAYFYFGFKLPKVFSFNNMWRQAQKKYHVDFVIRLWLSVAHWEITILGNQSLYTCALQGSTWSVCSLLVQGDSVSVERKLGTRNFKLDFRQSCWNVLAIHVYIKCLVSGCIEWWTFSWTADHTDPNQLQSFQKHQRSYHIIIFI